MAVCHSYGSAMAEWLYANRAPTYDHVAEMIAVGRSPLRSGNVRHDFGYLYIPPCFTAAASFKDLLYRLL